MMQVNRTVIPTNLYSFHAWLILLNIILFEDFGEFFGHYLIVLLLFSERENGLHDSGHPDRRVIGTPICYLSSNHPEPSQSILLL